ncbi:MAG TPA: hypothetical protein PLM89_03935 [Anaerolineales bacterium]|nr:hypothetical protein [Anaerolineales bacterium]
MNEPLSFSELSPLDQIRIAEAEVARMLIAAREASQTTLVEARAQASRLKADAHEAGIQRGQNRRQEIVSHAQEEARQIVENANKEAQTLEQRGKTQMEAAIHEALTVTLGLHESGNFYES